MNTSLQSPADTTPHGREATADAAWRLTHPREALRNHRFVKLFSMQDETLPRWARHGLLLALSISGALDIYV